MCVVGGGAAGLSVALALAGTRHSVCLLEAGGLRHETASQSLLAGETGDCGYPPLHTVRCAGLGGSTRVWAGWCRPLDAIDFEARDAVPHSGWPFGRPELDPWYARAHELLELGPLDYDPAAWEALSGTRRFPIAGGEFASVLFRRSTRGFAASRRRLSQASNIRVLLHAVALKLRYSPDGRHVAAVEATAPGGRPFHVRARATVIAAGGIETPRLLLLSSPGPRGPGNANGMVGRYFTEHGYHDGACFLPLDGRQAMDFYLPRVAAPANGAERVARGALAPVGPALRRHGLLNCAIYFRPLHEAHPVFDDAHVQAALELWEMLRSRAVPERRIERAIHALAAPQALMVAGWCRWRPRRRPAVERARVLTLFECAPDPANRVVLGRERDAFGRPVAALEWRIRETDLQSVSMAYRLLDGSLRAARLGRLVLDEPAARRRVSPGKHHLGTTRMHRDAAQGVVDPDAKVHGVDDLFVAGGSVFPTGGCANPTLTIVALAARLGAHLDSSLRAA